MMGPSLKLQDLGVREIALLVLLVGVSGCMRGPKPYEPRQDRKVYSIAVRQVAPEPVYKRVRQGYLPEPLPARTVRASNAPLILPVIHLDVQDVTLEEAAKVLASSARYSSYCASSIAAQRLSLSTLGTIDELATKIARTANVQVVVDHNNHEVRFMSGSKGGTEVVEPVFKSGLNGNGE